MEENWKRKSIKEDKWTQCSLYQRLKNNHGQWRDSELPTRFKSKSFSQWKPKWLRFRDWLSLRFNHFKFVLQRKPILFDNSKRAFWNLLKDENESHFFSFEWEKQRNLKETLYNFAISANQLHELQMIRRNGSKFKFQREGLQKSWRCLERFENTRKKSRLFKLVDESLQIFNVWNRIFTVNFL